MNSRQPPGSPALVARIISTVVGVLGTKPVLADVDVARIQVDVCPVEPEHLRLAEAERQGHDPSVDDSNTRRLTSAPQGLV